MTCKKILFVTSDSFPFSGASSNVLLKLLVQGGLADLYKILVLSKKDNSITQSTEYDCFKLFNYSIEEKKCVTGMTQRNKNIFLKIRRYLYNKKRSKAFYDKKDANTVYNSLKNIDPNEYDFIISVLGGKFFETVAVLKYCKKYKKPFGIYQLDPCMNNKGEPKSNHYSRIKFEKTLYKHAKFIITTPIIFWEHQSDSLCTHLDKVFPLEFPLVSPNIRVETTADKDVTKCLYCGSLYSNIRTPDYLLDLLAESLTKGKIELTFVGRNCDTFSSLRPELPIKWLGVVSSDEAKQMVDEAHVLINIGNTIDNQVPSKIFDYISSGKPIINLYKIKNCPTLKYLDKYPLALNIFENKDCFVENVQKIDSFLANVKTVEGVPSKYIIDLYKECTPEFCANRVKTIIEENY